MTVFPVWLVEFCVDVAGCRVGTAEQSEIFTFAVEFDADGTIFTNGRGISLKLARSKTIKCYEN